MKSEYQKPEILVISLDLPERIATDDNDDNYIDGEMGLESSIFG